MPIANYDSPFGHGPSYEHVGITRQTDSGSAHYYQHGRARAPTHEMYEGHPSLLHHQAHGSQRYSSSPAPRTFQRSSEENPKAYADNNHANTDLGWRQQQRREDRERHINTTTPVKDLSALLCCTSNPPAHIGGERLRHRDESWDGNRSYHQVPPPPLRADGRSRARYQRHQEEVVGGGDMYHPGNKQFCLGDDRRCICHTPQDGYHNSSYKCYADQQYYKPGPRSVQAAREDESSFAQMKSTKNSADDYIIDTCHLSFTNQVEQVDAAVRTVKSADQENYLQMRKKRSWEAVSSYTGEGAQSISAVTNTSKKHGYAGTDDLANAPCEIGKMQLIAHRGLVESIVDMISIHDSLKTNCATAYGNPAFLDRFSMPGKAGDVATDRIIPATLLQLVHDDDKEKLMYHFELVEHNPTESPVVTIRMLTKTLLPAVGKTMVYSFVQARLQMLAFTKQVLIVSRRVTFHTGAEYERAQPEYDLALGGFCYIKPNGFVSTSPLQQL